MTIELHWTLGDVAAETPLDPADLWLGETLLPQGSTLSWPNRMWHAFCVAAQRPDGWPTARDLVDLQALWRLAPPGDAQHLRDLLHQRQSADSASRTLHLLAALGAGWAAEAVSQLALPSPAPRTDSPLDPAVSRWRRRLWLLRSADHRRLFLWLGWCAWRFPRDLARLPLPEVARRLCPRRQEPARVGRDEMLRYVRYWQNHRWIPRPSYCLQRAALYYAGLTALGESAVLVFGLDPDRDPPVGHAWVNLDGEPYQEDPAILGRMAITYETDGISEHP